MKHIKIYENFSDNESDIEVGDFAIFYYDEVAQYTYHAKLNPTLKDYINNNVGYITNVSNKENLWIEVLYENLPYSSNKIILTKDNIVKYSKNKEELEIYLNANKYNL